MAAKKKARTKRRNHGYENQAEALHERRKRTTRKNSTVPMSGMRTRSAEKRRRGERFINPRERYDEHDVYEILLAVDNDYPVYEMAQATRKSLATKRVRGTYDHDKALKAWQNVAGFAAQSLQRQYGRFDGPGQYGSYGRFSPATRRRAASEMLQHFIEEFKSGELDYLLPKKYQPKKNVSIAGNPAHFPRTNRGPKGNNKRWYILDLYDGRDNLISTRIKQGARAKLATEATGLVNHKAGKKIVRKVELSGPYSRKPTKTTTRK